MRRHWKALVVLAAAALVPAIGLNSYLMHMLILVVMWAVIGMAWNLLGGYCGQVSFGHAAFFGVGAYTSGLLYGKLGVSAWWGVPASIPVVALFALGFGGVCLRLRGPYFALGTLASSVILRIVAENLVPLTGGDLGIMIRERTWVGKTWYYYAILGIAALAYPVIELLMASKLGYYFLAIREDQDAAESLGIDTARYKTIALCVSAVLTGMAGAFYTNYMGYIDPKVVFALHDVSIITIMVVMVGGVATRSGPLVGALLMVLLAEGIRSLPWVGPAHNMIFGLLLIATIRYLPNGIMGRSA
jgi:branched-chain amino acid transport system permease protein